MKRGILKNEDYDEEIFIVAPGLRAG